MFINHNLVLCIHIHTLSYYTYIVIPIAKHRRNILTYCKIYQNILFSPQFRDTPLWPALFRAYIVPVRNSLYLFVIIIFL